MTTDKCVWPSGDDKPVCLFCFGHEIMASRFGLNFENGVDDLDEYFATYFIDEDIGPINLIEHVSQPIKGVAAHVDSRIETRRAIDVIRAKFQLSDSDFAWIRDVGD